MRIGHEPVVGKPTVFKQTAGLSGDRRRCIERACELSDVSVGEKRSECGVLAQRGRACNAVGPYRGLAGIHREAFQHQIKQRGISTRTGYIEGVQQRLPCCLGENVHVVQRDSTKQLRALAADVTRFERQISRQLSLKFQVEVLNVGIHTMIVKAAQRVRAYIEGLRREGLDIGGGRHRNRKIRRREVQKRIAQTESR